MFEIVVSVLYTLDDRLALSSGSSGRGLSRSEGVERADARLGTSLAGLDGGDVAISSPCFCSSSSALDGGGGVSPMRWDEPGRISIVDNHSSQSLKSM
jgi:hypothetical protein